MAQLRWKEVSSEIAEKNIEVCKEVVCEGNLFDLFNYTKYDFNLVIWLKMTKLKLTFTKLRSTV